MERSRSNPTLGFRLNDQQDCCIKLRLYYYVSHFHDSDRELGAVNEIGTTISKSIKDTIHFETISYFII